MMWFLGETGQTQPNLFKTKPCLAGRKGKEHKTLLWQLIKKDIVSATVMSSDSTGQEIAGKLVLFMVT